MKSMEGISNLYDYKHDESEMHLGPNKVNSDKLFSLKAMNSKSSVAMIQVLVVLEVVHVLVQNKRNFFCIGGVIVVHNNFYFYMLFIYKNDRRY